MSIEEALAWTVTALLALALGALAWNTAAQYRRRKARRRRYEEALAQDQQLRREAVLRSARRHTMHAASAEAIRRDAEAAARRVARGLVPKVANPHASGTPEFVLWLTTYHLALSDLVEKAATAEEQPWEARTPASRY
jgi:hypothetical protein